jgi:protein phosphatase
MATTLVAAIVRAGEAWIANVGDSRASLVREGVTEAISEDHSLVAESLREGEMTEEEAWTSNLRHVITRTVGSEEEVDVDIFGPLTLGAEETLVLSSDGLHDLVEADEIAAIAGGDDLEAAAEALVAAANAAGGPDNITVVLYRA